MRNPFNPSFGTQPAGYGKVKFALPLFKQFVLDDGQYLINVGA